MVTRLRYAGFANEATYGETPIPEATLHVDIASATLDSPTDPDIIYEGGLQRAANVRRPGFYAPVGNVAYAFDIDSIGPILRRVLGGYVFTADAPESGLNTHEFYGSGEAELPSFVTRLGKDKLADATNFEHVFSGCIASQLSIETSDAMAMATVDIMAAKDSRDDIKEIGDLLLPASYPLAFHELTASISGSDRSSLIKSVNLSINNNGDTGAGRSIGSRFPRRVPVGERVTMATFDLFWESLTQLQLFWGDPDGPVAGDIPEFPISLVFDAGDDGGLFTNHKTLTIQLPNAWYTQAKQQATGRSELVQSLSARALLDTVTLLDAVTEVDTEIYVKLINAQDSLV